MSQIDRGVYQKVCEENKRMKKDIKVLTEINHTAEHFDKKLKIFKRWRTLFKEEEDNYNILKKYLKLKK